MCVSVVIVDLLEFELLELERQRTEKNVFKEGCECGWTFVGFGSGWVGLVCG